MFRSILGKAALAAAVALTASVGVREAVATAAPAPRHAKAPSAAVLHLTYDHAAAIAHAREPRGAPRLTPAEKMRRPYCADESDCQATCDRLYPGQEKFGVCSQGHTCYCY